MSNDLRLISSEWSKDKVMALFELPFNDLLFQAHNVHRQNFPGNVIQLSSLLSIKTGGCPEDCRYCPQSARYATGVRNEPLMGIEQVVQAAAAAKELGATRFCMGAAWRGPKDRDIEAVAKMVSEVKALGLETCVTLGLLRDGQAERLREAGLDYYNHNVDTAAASYRTIISTRTYESRLATLKRVRDAGIRVCCGGILGMGETREERAQFICELATMDPAPESVPLNHLIKVPGTPLEEAPALDPFEFVRTIAAARITMPTSYVRLSAGRRELGDAIQAMCFFAGANSIFYGEKLLTADNVDQSSDARLLRLLGMRTQSLA